MKQLRDKQGKFKSNGIKNPKFTYTSDGLGLTLDGTEDFFMWRNEITKELNALKAWKEEHEAKHKEMLYKQSNRIIRVSTRLQKMEMRKDIKEQLGDLLYQWKWGEEWDKSKSAAEIREEILELLVHSS